MLSSADRHVDPLFHQQVIGLRLQFDLFFYNEDTLLSLLSHHGSKQTCPSWKGLWAIMMAGPLIGKKAAAMLLSYKTPAVLVVNARAYHSLIALLKGLWMPCNSYIKGVILNQVNTAMNR